MDDRDKKITDMNAELERLRRRIAELGSGAAPGMYDEGYRLLFENNPLPLWVFDLETLAILMVNDAAVRKYGYSREEFLGMTVADIRPREDLPRLMENIACVTCGIDEAGLWRHRKKDGAIIDVEIVSHTLNFEGRKAELVLAHDITERRQAEAKIRTIARLYAFLSQINQAIVRTRDRDELFRTICRVAIEFGQFSMAWVGLIDEATGIVRPAAHAGREEGYLNSLSIGIHDEATSSGPTGSALREGVLTICDDIATDPRMLPWREEALKRGYRSSAAIPFRLRDKVIGSLNLCAAEPGFFTEDERKLLTEIGIDISFALDTMEGEKERRRAEESLYLKNYVFDVAIAANSIADTNGVITQANQAFLTIWGYSSKEEVIGRQIPEFLQNADDAAAIIAALNTTGKWEGNYTARKKEGSTFTAFGLATVLKDEQGKTIGYQSSVLDVTESKRMEEALRESEERYRTLFETMAQGVVYQAPDGRIISANPAAEHILGVSIDQMQGRTSMDPRWRAIREDGSDFPGDQHPAMEALRTGKPVHDTIMGVFHPGKNEYRWILVNAVPEVLPGETRPYQVYATFTDLTERRRADSALRVGEARMRAIIERAPFGSHSYELQPDGRLILSGANHAANRILSLDHAQLIGKTIEEAFPGLVGTDIPDTYRRIAATGAVHETDKVVYERDHIHGAFAIHAFQTGPQRMTVFFQDITERKKAEHALRESEERLRLALGAAKQGLYDLNVQTGEAIVSPEYAQMLGYAPEEFFETNAKWIERLHPDDRAPVADTYRAYVNGSLPEYRVEFRQRTKSGEWKWILSIGKIVEYDAAGNPLRMLGTHTDITNRKQAEQERLELERRLLHAQKLESLGILAGGIAHDFNNLLMAVLGNLDLALRKLSPADPARLNIERSAQAASRAADLTRQMLAYSGKGSFVVKPMDLSEIVEENAHLFRSSVARTTELNVRLDRPLPAIEADAGQVQQVIMNLITNASEAIGEKTGVITLTTGVQDCDSQCLKRSRIEDVPDAGRFVFLEVSDNGCGMDEQTQQRLFDPFFTTKSTGRGLGMSAILGIVRGHRGAIFVDSAAGTGTTIRVLFPASQRPLAVNDGPAGEAAREAADPVAGGTVLVVDDEEIVRNVCKEMVEALGFPVLTAVDGRDAVDLFTKHADDIGLVILDLSMPNMDGMTAFQELVRIRPGVKVILCSGFDEQDSLQRLSGQGLAGFIQKPYSMKNLREALEKAGVAGG